MGNEQGLTLIEVLISSMVIVVTILTIFIGIVFAEKQLTRNYRDRVATLHASGELDWQYYHKKTYNTFASSLNREVTIDRLPKNRSLRGRLSTAIKEENELAGGSTMIYDVFTVRVTWTEPGDNKTRFIEMKEEFYR